MLSLAIIVVILAVRSCGSNGCKSNAARAVVFRDIEIKGVTTLAGFSHERGDTVDIESYSGSPAKNMCQDKDAGTAGTPVGFVLLLSL